MDTMISEWGNSLGLRIPKSYAKAMGLKSGSKVQMVLEKNRLVIRPAKKYSLKTLIGGISEENRYGEADFGKPEGREVW